MNKENALEHNLDLEYQETTAEIEKYPVCDLCEAAEYQDLKRFKMMDICPLCFEQHVYKCRGCNTEEFREDLDENLLCKECLTK